VQRADFQSLLYEFTSRDPFTYGGVIRAAGRRHHDRLLVAGRVRGSIRIALPMSSHPGIAVLVVLGMGAILNVWSFGRRWNLCRVSGSLGIAL
jgi:hypothetical protein